MTQKPEQTTEDMVTEELEETRAYRAERRLYC